MSKNITGATDKYLQRFLNGVEKRNQNEPEFIQAVSKVAESIFPYIADKPIYHEMQILERMAEPDRVVMFRVPWTDDEGNIQPTRLQGPVQQLHWPLQGRPPIPSVRKS